MGYLDAHCEHYLLQILQRHAIEQNTVDRNLRPSPRRTKAFREPLSCAHHVKLNAIASLYNMYSSSSKLGSGNDTGRGTVYLSLSGPGIAYTASLCMVGLIATSYLTCVHQENCPKFLPTISDTWVHSPGNYLSRWIVSLVCLLFQFGIVQ